MTKPELKTAVMVLGLTVEQTARKLGVSKSWLEKMLSPRCGKKVSAPVAAKIRELLTGVSSLPEWRRCPYCGGDLLRQSKMRGGGWAVQHRCPAEGGVAIKISSRQLGIAMEQAKAALERRAR